MSKSLSLTYGVVFLALATLRAFQESDLVLGMFEIDHAQNWIHIGSGILGMLAGIAGTYQARLYLWTAGLFYLSIAVAWFISGAVPGIAFNQADGVLFLAVSAFSLYTVFAEDPHLGQGFTPITGRRGVTDFREPAHRW